MAHVPVPRLSPLLLALALWSGWAPAAPAGAQAGGGPVAGPAPQVVPLLRVEPAPGEPSPDLDALLGWLGDAPLVGLGENPHGVHEYHRLAHRLFAHSHAGGSPHEPFGVFALEIDQAHAARLDGYVQGRRDDLDALLAERWYGSKIFYDEALADLLRWMRAHNHTAARPVHVAGYDLKQPALALDAVEEALRRIEPGLAAQARALREPILALGGYGLFPNVRGYTASVTLSLPPAGPGGGARRVSAEVWVRGEGGGHGTAGMLATGVGERFGEARKSHDLALPEIDGAWTPIRIHLSLPATMEEAQVWLYHRGNGVVWFDRLRVEVDGRPLGPTDLLGELEPWDLMMPKIQVMDYGAERDPSVAAPGDATPDDAGDLPALRVTCDPRVDRALEAVRRLESLVAAAVDATGDAVSPADAAWTVQMARLVVQAVHWRTLVENNRDVFLAENLTWLRESGFPDRRVLALGHQAHTEPFPLRMGSFLAGRYGDRYATVTLQAETGTYAYFGDVTTLGHDAPLELHAVEDARRRELVPVLAALGEGDLLVNLGRLAATEPQALAAVADAVPRPDVAVLLRRVTPARVPGEAVAVE